MAAALKPSMTVTVIKMRPTGTFDCGRGAWGLGVGSGVTSVGAVFSSGSEVAAVSVAVGADMPGSSGALRTDTACTEALGGRAGVAAGPGLIGAGGVDAGGAGAAVGTGTGWTDAAAAGRGGATSIIGRTGAGVVWVSISSSYCIMQLVGIAAPRAQSGLLFRDPQALPAGGHH